VTSLTLERLQKIISRAGIASRRHAELLIQSGQVRVNGHVVNKLGTKADPGRDRIEAAGHVVELQAERAYIILHKPPRVVATLADPEGRQSLRELLRGIPVRVFPVGRLEFAAGGLVFLTNDGELANRLLKLSAKLPQTYWVKVKGRLSDDDQARVAAQAHARVEPLRAPQAGKGGPNPWYEVKFSDARRDLLRTVLFKMGHPVEKLRRVGLANLELDDLPEGSYRPLQVQELRKLIQAIDRNEKLPSIPRGGAAPRKPLMKGKVTRFARRTS
jgi:pseudouridine synthase